MNKTKLLSISCLLLLFINIGLLIFIFLENKQSHNGDRNRNIIIKQLGFDEKQIHQYDSLIKIHRGKTNMIDDSINLQRRNLYALLNSETKPKDSLLMLIAKQDENLETNNFEHFLAIKKICKPNQMFKYEALTKELSELFDKNSKRKEGK